MKWVAVYLLSLALFVVISAARDDPDDEEMVKFKEFKVIGEFTLAGESI